MSVWEGKMYLRWGRQSSDPRSSNEPNDQVPIGTSVVQDQWGSVMHDYTVTWEIDNLHWTALRLSPRDSDS